MAYFVFCSKMESGYQCYYCNEKFDWFKDIFNHLIEKHNAETFKIKKLIFFEKEGVLGYTTSCYLYFLIPWQSDIWYYYNFISCAFKRPCVDIILRFLYFVFSISHPISTQDTNIIPKTLAQGMILVEGKYEMWYGKSYVILCLSYTVSKCCTVSTIPNYIASIN